MKVDVVYVYPQVIPRIYFPLAKRFATTYTEFPAGFDHTLNVVCNGGAPAEISRELFADIPACQIHVRSNLGWDIGAFQWGAETLKCDLLVCLGSHCHLHRPGWLERMVDAYIENGPHYYGCRGYYYPAGHGHHIRTTCFWMAPALLQSYPFIVGNAREARYAFEHGANNITQWVEKAGLKCLVATWDDIYGIDRWKEGFGPPQTSLVLDQWTHEPGSRLDRG